MSPKHVKEVAVEVEDDSPATSSGASSPVVVGATTIIENLVERLEKLERKTARQGACSDSDSESELGDEDDAVVSHDHKDKKHNDKKTEEEHDDDRERHEPVDSTPELIKKLYEGKSKCKCCTNWVAKYPKGVEKPTEEIKEKWRNAALLLRYKKAHSDIGEDPFQLYSLTIQSPHLRKLAQVVLEGYPAIDTSLQKLVFKAPFWPFFHRWARLEEYRESASCFTSKGVPGCTAKVDEELEHVNLLYDVLDQELRDDLTTSRELAANGNINFELLYTIYPPGAVVFERTGSIDRCYLVTDAEYGNTKRSESLYFMVHLAYLDYDGDMYGWTRTKTYMFSFKDVRRISELKLIPREYRQGADDVLTYLASRGKKAKTLVTGAYKAYEGFTENHKGEPWINGRIVIDPAEYLRATPSRHFLASLYPVGLRSIVPKGEACLFGSDVDEIAKNAVVEDTHIVPPPDLNGNPPFGDPFPVDPFASLGIDAMPPMPYAPHPIKKRKAKAKANKRSRVFNGPSPPFTSDPVSDDEDFDSEQGRVCTMETMHKWTAKVFGIEPEAFCPSTVTGYCLTAKEWTTFAVDNVRDIEWNDEAFDKLVMPRPRKRLLKALVQEHRKHKGDTDDVVRGKGQGLVLLLAGPPGTGKTLTAESIADRLRLPLYAMDANQLGERSSSYDEADIEEELNKVFKLAAAWDAVLLLEEADAFLEPRVDDDEARERNKRIAAFLRVLEYYKGVLIMTTNRSTQFDDALYSRIHLTLRFPELDHDAKRAVWRNFLNPVSVDITDQDFRNLAREDMNGRQIKNVVKMARLLAENEDEALTVDHLMDVIQVIKDSDKDRPHDSDEEESEDDSEQDPEEKVAVPMPPAPPGVSDPFAMSGSHTFDLPVKNGSKWSYKVSVG